MMQKYLLMALVLVLALSACNNKATPAQDTVATTATTEIKGETFGESVTAEGAMRYEELLTQIRNQDSMAVKVLGTVEAVCQMKGCWMNIVSGKDGDPVMMVKFKDYGFFVPKDIAGRQVIMQGYAYREVTPVDELRHYAEDAGKSAAEIEAITEPREELKFMASGVLLIDAASEK
ncbi:MAG TPA: DUF4920 domain-containing protein [Saprospiraceae bacterium]|nr:DUF4920 domain-containing protein [Saprospiraceae bacterium]HMP13857.1 DUF4920 domain-containing protein [Saprospiraceae bacterium]